MTILAVDTSVAIPLVMSSHGEHHRIRAWAHGRALALSGHALAETYSVLTRLPGDARLAPEDAATLIDSNFTAKCTLPQQQAEAIHRTFAQRGIAGGAVYDALVAAAAAANDLVLATRDARAQATYFAWGVAIEVVR